MEDVTVVAENQEVEAENNEQREEPEKGDTVKHLKYGVGTVSRVDKTTYSIPMMVFTTEEGDEVYRPTDEFVSIPSPVKEERAKPCQPEIETAEQINAADAMIMEFLDSLADNQGFKDEGGGWKDFGCNKHRKAEKGRILFVFDGGFYPPDVRTERGGYSMGGFSGEYVGGSDVKMKPFLDTIMKHIPGLTVEREYAILSPVGGIHIPWGPVLSMDYKEMILICQQVGMCRQIETSKEV